MGNATSVGGLWERRIIWIGAHGFQADVQTADGFRLLSSGTPAPAPVTWLLLIFVEHPVVPNACTYYSIGQTLLLLKPDHRAPALCANHWH